MRSWGLEGVIFNSAGYKEDTKVAGPTSSVDFPKEYAHKVPRPYVIGSFVVDLY